MAELGASQPALPEVPLQWVDFMWSLEKLRHKPYGKKLRERSVCMIIDMDHIALKSIFYMYFISSCVMCFLCRDWFRINPLEMVLLGAHSIASNTPAKRDVSADG